MNSLTSFMQVLLGESVLQLIVSEMPTAKQGMSEEEERSLQRKFELMQIAGFVISNRRHTLERDHPVPPKKGIRKPTA